MEYKPKTGKNAGKKNFQKIKDLLAKDPHITGIKIANKLKLSKATVYNHLKKLQE